MQNKLANARLWNSDEEIAKTLAAKRGFDLPEHLNRGYNHTEIVDHLVLGNDLKPKVSLGNAVANKLSGANKEASTSLGGVVNSLGRGLAEGLTTELTGMAGGATQFIGAKTGLSGLENSGRDLKDWSENKSKEWFGEQPDRSGIETAIYEGSKMLAPSVIPGAAATTAARGLMGVGRLTKAAQMAHAAGDLAKATELAGMATKASKAALTAGSAIPAVVLYGTNQAQQTIDSANNTARELRAKGDEAGAQKALEAASGVAPYLTGAIEAAGEFFGTKYLGKLFGVAEGVIAKRTTKELAVDFLKTLGVEGGTEFGQSLGQAAVEKQSGARPDADPLGEALSVLGPTAFMTLLTGGLAAGANATRSPNLSPAQEEGTPPVNPAEVLGYNVGVDRINPGEKLAQAVEAAAHGVGDDVPDFGGVNTAEVLGFDTRTGPPSGPGASLAEAVKVAQGATEVPYKVGDASAVADEAIKAAQAGDGSFDVAREVALSLDRGNPLAQDIMARTDQAEKDFLAAQKASPVGVGDDVPDFPVSKAQEMTPQDTTEQDSIRMANLEKLAKISPVAKKNLEKLKAKLSKQSIDTTADSDKIEDSPELVAKVRAKIGEATSTENIDKLQGELPEFIAQRPELVPFTEEFNGLIEAKRAEINRPALTAPIDQVYKSKKQAQRVLDTAVKDKSVKAGEYEIAPDTERGGWAFAKSGEKIETEKKDAQTKTPAGENRAPGQQVVGESSLAGNMPAAIQEPGNGGVGRVEEVAGEDVQRVGIAQNRQAPPEIVTKKDIYGMTHYVRKDQYDAGKKLLARHGKDGKPLGPEKNNRFVHIENLDPTGEKATESWKDLPYIAGKMDKGYATAKGAELAVRQHGQAVEDFDIKEMGGRFAAIRKPANLPSAGPETSPPKAQAAALSAPGASTESGLTQPEVKKTLAFVRGARKASAEGSARVKAAQQQLRETMANPDITGKSRTDRIAAGKNLIQFLEAKAGSEIETDYFKGDQIAFTDEGAPEGLRSAIVLEGPRAGEYIRVATKESRDATAKRNQDEWREQQDGFSRVAQATGDQQSNKTLKQDQQVTPSTPDNAGLESSKKPASEMTAAELLRAAADKMEGKAKESLPAQEEESAPADKTDQRSEQQGEQAEVQVEETLGAEESKIVLEDFGEKIGGARKDTTRPREVTGPRKTTADKDKSWRKRFKVMENSIAPGEWMIADTKGKRGSNIMRQKFSSQEDAEKALPIAVIAQNHIVRENDGQWEIYKKVTDRKLLRIVNKTFHSREEGMIYLAKHAEELLDIKTTFGEEILPVPEIAVREGVERRTIDATPEMFMETFSPRGIEFGNWNNQDERQLVLNHAYDGLLDLADVLNLSPKALMLNGDLAIAFGARGQGLKGAKAHYESDYGVINLTKMKGAGSLAHEWFHALDHYLARQDQKSSSEKVKNVRGDLVYKTSSPKYDMQTHGPSYGSKVREELRESLRSLVQLMFRKAEHYVDDTKKMDKFLSVGKTNLRDSLNNIRRALESDYSEWRKRNGKPASAEQLADFDRLADTLVEGGDLETKWIDDPKSKAKFLKGRHTNSTLEAINDILLAVRGRKGFAPEGKGSLDSVRAAMNTYAQRIKMFEDAEKGVEKTKKVPTSYAVEAKKMDQARSGDYWSEPHEMAARAFASYVEDKISEKGWQSDFIVYQAHGGIILPMIDGFVARPYPEGKERIAINKAFDDFVSMIKTKETDKGTALFSRMNKEPWPADFPNAATHTTLSKLTEHKDYKAAKAGDIEAAIRLVADLVKPAKLKELFGQYGDAIVAAPHAEEATGRNAIPRVLAEAMGDAGFQVDTEIVQTNKAARTKKGSALRLAVRPEFGGQVIAGQKYLVVDDALGMGGTASELRYHIESNGGKVVFISALTSGIFGNKISITSGTIAKLETRFGKKKLEDFLYEFNTAGSITALTEKEGRYILKQPSLNALRDKILEEAREAGISPSAWQVQASFSRLADAEASTVQAGKITEKAESLRAELNKSLGQSIPEGAITEVLVRDVLPSSEGRGQTGGRGVARLSNNGNGGQTLSGAEVARRVAKAFRKEIVFFKDTHGVGINGAHFSGDTIYVNVDAAHPYLAITGHEILHTLRKENPLLYKNLLETLVKEMKASAFKDYGTWLSSKTEAEGNGQASDSLVMEEMAANFLGDQMMEPAFWNKVKGHDPSLFQKIVSFVRSLLDKLKNRAKLNGLRSSEYFRNLEAVQDAMAKTVAGYGRDSSEDTGNTDASSPRSEIIKQAKDLYSKLEQVATSAFQGMKAQSVLNFLNKQGVKKTEIEATGLDAWIKAKKPTDKVSREKLMNFVRANIVDLEDVVLGAPEFTVIRNTEAKVKWPNIPWIMDGEWVAVDRGEPLFVLEADNAEEALRAAKSNYREDLDEDRPDTTHFSQYTEPGAVEGSYREMFVTVPEKELTQEVMSDPEATKRAFDKRAYWQDGHSQYQDVKNPIIRIRFNTVEADGKKILRIEEMQGPNPDNQAKMPAYLKDNIYQLGVKRIIAYAKENGFDGVALSTKHGMSPGETQADRYSLEKQIKEIKYEQKVNKYQIAAYDFNGGLVLGDTYAKEKLPEAIGKDLANKIINSDRYKGTLKGVELVVGGEGLRTLYDSTIPDMLEAYGKGKMEATTLPETSNLSWRDKPSRLDYEGPVPTRQELDDMHRLSRSYGPDIFANPFTGKREDFAINRVANANGLEEVTRKVDEGTSIKQALSESGVFSLFGAEVTRVVEATTMPYLPINHNTPASFPLFSRAFDDDLASVAAQAPEKIKKGSGAYIDSKKDIGLFDLVFSTIEHYADKVPVIKRYKEVILSRVDRKFKLEMEMFNATGEDALKVMEDLYKQDRKQYDRLAKYLVARDRNKDGFRMERNDGVWAVYPPGKEDPLFEGLSEEEAVAKMVNAEAEHLRGKGFSEQAVDALITFRAVMNKGFDKLVEQLRALEAEAAENNQDAPTIEVPASEKRWAIYKDNPELAVEIFRSKKEAQLLMSELEKDGVKRMQYRLNKFYQAGQSVQLIERTAEQMANDPKTEVITLSEAIAEMGDLRGTYFPRQREPGELILTATKEGKNPILKKFDLGAAAMEGDTVNIATVKKLFNVFTPLGREIRRLEREGYSWTVKKDESVAEDLFDVVKLVSSVEGVLQSAAQKAGAGDNQIVNEINRILVNSVADIFKGRGYLSARIRRNGREGQAVYTGYEEDPTKAMTKYVKSLSGGMAKRDVAREATLVLLGKDISWGAYQEENTDAEYDDYLKLVEGRKLDPGKQKTGYHAVMTHYRENMRNEERIDRIIGTMKGLAVLKFLGSRVSSAAVNLTNMAMAVPAVMNGIGKIPYHKTWGHIGGAALSYGKYLNGGGSKEDRAIFELINANGWDEAQFNMDAARVLQSRLGGGWNWFMAKSMAMFGATEKVNRATTIFAAYKALVAEGMNKEEAVKLAKEISDKAHGVYGKATLPHMAMGKGPGQMALRLAYTFQKFSHNYMLTAKRLGWDEKEYGAAAHMILAPAVLAGAGASVATPILAAIVKAFGGGDDPEEEMYRWAEESFGGGEWLRHGAVGLGGRGVNLKGSLQINFAVPTTLAEFLGAPISVLTDEWRGLQDIKKGNVQKGLERMAPSGLAAPSRAIREYREGVTTHGNAPIFFGDDPIKGTGTDAVVRFFSFNPSRLSSMRETQWSDTKVEREYAERKSGIYDNIRSFYMTDPAKRNLADWVDILAEINEYNERVIGAGRPALSRISSKSVIQMLRRSFRPSKRERLRPAGGQ